MKSRSKIINIAAALLFLTATVACDEKLSYQEETITTPAIIDFSPKTGPAGTEITIYGEHLQQVDKVLIGDLQVPIKYKINSNQLIVKVLPEVRNGKITLAYSSGQATGNDSFTITYLEPTLTDYPLSGKTNEEIVLKGQNMDAVVAVFFGSASAEIVLRSNTEVLVKIPFIEESEVSIFLAYNDAEGTKQTEATGDKFTSIKPVPKVDTYTTHGKAGDFIVITGQDLTQVDKVVLGLYEATISEKTETSLTAIVPDGYEQTSTVTLKLIYHATQELIVTTGFEVAVAGIYFWPNVTIYGPAAPEQAHFLNVLSGVVYGPCQFETYLNQIYFFITVSGSNGVQLHSPAQNVANVGNYLCNGAKLAIVGNNVRFRVLDESNESDLLYINAVKNKTLEYIAISQLETDGLAHTGSTQVIRYHADPTKNNYQDGSVFLFELVDAGGAPLKAGFVEVVKITTANVYTDKTVSIKMNCYFQK